MNRISKAFYRNELHDETSAEFAKSGFLGDGTQSSLVR
ncbi:hypothetical protein QFZ96_001687 [Paraburkholderia youngii]